MMNNENKSSIMFNGTRFLIAALLAVAIILAAVFLI